MAALTSPIIMELKLRFKNLLKDNIKYADGMKPSDISQFMSKIADTDWFFSTDAKKFDRQ